MKALRLKNFNCRILLVSSEFPPGPGGIGDHAYNLANQLSLSGSRISVLSEIRNEFDTTEDFNPHIELSLIPSDRFFRNVLFVITYFKLLLKFKPQIIICTGSKSVRLVGVCNLIFRKKVVAILHGHEVLMGNYFMRFILREVLPLFSLAVCVSEFSKMNSIRFIDESKICVISNGFNPEKFAKRRVRKEKSSQLNLVTVGRVSLRKGQHNVILALPLIISKYPELKYHIIGMNNESQYLKSLIAELALEKYVMFHGVVDNFTLNKLLVQMDISCMLSENLANGDVEGFGIAIIEGNFLGIPGIGSKGCGIEQAINDGYNGVLVNSGKKEEILNAIDNIMNKYDYFSNNSYDWAKQHTWEVIGKKYISALSNL